MTYSTESRPKGAYVRGAELAALSSTAERTMETVHELAARWHRADERRRALPIPSDLFTGGLMAGYVQAVSLLTGVPCAQVERQFIERKI